MTDGSIHPWGSWVAVTDPPAETQDGTYKGTGLHLPEGTGLDVVQKGVVMAAGPEVNAPAGFEAGAVCWYMGSQRLELGIDAQLKFVPDNAIICWEAA